MLKRKSVQPSYAVMVFTNIIQKMVRQWRDYTISRIPLEHGPAGKDKISLVIYFDYEREFGNKSAKDSAEKGFHKIIEALKIFNVKATWNCVGLIAKHYPETIEKIIIEGHEVACHTYSHIVPILTERDKLASDIDQAKLIFEKRFNIQLRGFHSPQDAWSKNLIKILIDRNFSYDIVLERKPKVANIHYVRPINYFLHPPTSYLLRIPSLTDDWEIVSKSLPPEAMFAKWREFSSRKYLGRCFAIGFHPWIIGMNSKNMEAFSCFIRLVKLSKNIVTFTGSEIAQWAKSQTCSLV